MFNCRKYVVILIGLSSIVSCQVPLLVQKTENRSLADSYTNTNDTANVATVSWKNFFTDPNLVNLIDTALKRNQELNITLQEIEMAKNDILFRQGALKPMVNARLGIGVEKVGRYTSQGAGDASADI
jgi:outer membrane protein TolC